MTKRLVGQISLFLGLISVVAGAALAILPGIAFADPPVQREAFADTACLNCHTDQARLREITEDNTPDEPEEASLSSGPG